jgi:hypothetical protein
VTTFFFLQVADLMAMVWNVWGVGGMTRSAFALRVEGLRICDVERDRAGFFRLEARFRALSRVRHAKLH